MIPEGLKYTLTHEWCRTENGYAVIGVTKRALTSLGELICIELPDVGDDVLCEIAFGQIGGVRKVKDLISPLDGLVVEVNGRVAHDPDLLAKSPYDEGWLIRLRLESSFEPRQLLSAAEYRQVIRRKRSR